MISFFRLAALLSALLFSTAGFAAELPETFKVNRIKIKGTERIEKKEVTSVLMIRPPSRWRFWKKHPDASEEDISDDTERIAQYYKSIGYYSANVTYDVRLVKKTAARVTYRIKEGEPVTVDSIVIEFDGNEEPVPVEDLLGAISLQTGMRFEEKAYRESKQTILKKLGSNGYPMAQVTGKALIYPSTNKATVTFVISPGRLCFFGDTTVISDEPIVSEKVLERSRTYRTETLYDTRKVDQSQRNLYNLDIFKTAVIQPGTPDPDTGIVPMTLELKPKKKQSIKLGVGYGDEDGLRLRAGWSYRNPFDRAGKLTFEAKRTDLLEKASAGYSQPYFWDARSALHTEAGVLREFFDSFESDNLYGTARITRKMKSHLDLTAAYFLEYSELKDLNLTDPEELAAFREDHSFFISSVFLEIELNTVDNETNPEKGGVVTASVDFASTLFGSELAFIKPSIEYKKYFELPLGIVLAGRVRFETIFDPETNDDIPIFKRLFLGGANTVRGFSFQKLGPLDETGNPEGGLSSALANIELRRPIVGILSGVLFLDMGMLDEDKLHYSEEEVYTSTGAGLRVDTPLGPLRLDYGYKLNPTEKTDRWRIHFNIGHAF